LAGNDKKKKGTNDLRTRVWTSTIYITTKLDR
jgi:hypothetical protein